MRFAIVALERKGRKENVGIYRDAASYLAAGKVGRTEVNVGRLSLRGDGKSPMFVPGKVLGWGVLDKKVIVGAFSFSSAARKKIESSGGEAMVVAEFMKRYPDRSGVRLVR